MYKDYIFVIITVKDGKRRTESDPRGREFPVGEEAGRQRRDEEGGKREGEVYIFIKKSYL